MGFTDKHCITELPTERDTERLSVSVDSDTGNDFRDPTTKAMLLYVPYLPDHEHEHISLTDEAAKQLHYWLGQYLLRKGLGRGDNFDNSLKAFFKIIEHGEPKHRAWLAKEFSQFWGVEVTPVRNGDIPE